MRWELSAPSVLSPLPFNIGNLKLHDLAKLWFLKIDYDEVELKISVARSFQ